MKKRLLRFLDAEIKPLLAGRKRPRYAYPATDPGVIKMEETLERRFQRRLDNLRKLREIVERSAK